MWRLLLGLLGFFDLSATPRLEEISVEVPVAWQWLPLPAPQTSAVLLRRAVDGAGRPYDATPPPCTPAPVRRSLRMDRAATSPPDKPERLAFLQGEPILFEMRVEAEGGCRWQEPLGGNYRGRGRDDNFAFFVRRADGSWVDDPYGDAPVYVGGGLSTTVEVTAGKPFSYWLALPRWATLDAPGRYQVFAVQLAHGHDILGLRQALAAAIPRRLSAHAALEPDSYYVRDSKTGARLAQLMPTIRDRAAPSPVALPVELRARLGARADAVQDFAEWRFEIVAASPAQRADMVRTWTQLAETRSERFLASKADAARDAMLFARGDDFLPAVGRWLAAGQSAAWDGLAMNPSPRALALLLRAPSEQPLYALHHLSRGNIAAAIPALIERVDDPADAVRAIVDERLRAWTGEKLGAAWDGYQLGRPTRAEAAARKPAWRAWWRSHQAAFTPR